MTLISQTVQQLAPSNPLFLARGALSGNEIVFSINKNNQDHLGTTAIAALAKLFYTETLSYDKKEFIIDALTTERTMFGEIKATLGNTIKASGKFANARASKIYKFVCNVSIDDSSELIDAMALLYQYVSTFELTSKKDPLLYPDSNRHMKNAIIIIETLAEKYGPK
jgi:hypothetical protein